MRLLQLARLFPRFGSLGFLAVLCGHAAEPGRAPVTLSGAETHVYRELEPEPLRVHVFKPRDWKRGDRRAAFLWFFGGGWRGGTPMNSAGTARWAASHGMVGFAPDYRVNERFGTSPLEAVADARAAVRWVQDRAEEFGIDPRCVIVGGNSAGGHLALWTALEKSPPGSVEVEAPLHSPAALVLTCPVSDTSSTTGYTPERFGPHAAALSPVHQIGGRMPPVLVFHGDADRIVPPRQTLELRRLLVAGGNVCEFVTVPGGGHNFASDLPEWRDRTKAMTLVFLRAQGVLR